MEKCISTSALCRQASVRVNLETPPGDTLTFCSRTSQLGWHPSWLTLWLRPRLHPCSWLDLVPPHLMVICCSFSSYWSRACIPIASCPKAFGPRILKPKRGSLPHGLGNLLTSAAKLWAFFSRSGLSTLAAFALGIFDYVVTRCATR